VVREELTSIQRTLDQVDTQRVTAAGMDEITGVIAIPPGARRGRRRRWIRVAASVGMAVVAGLVGALAVRSCLSGGK
jgi:Ethanolamine utilization protein EutJ (predicted chaperonin)